MKPKNSSSYDRIVRKDIMLTMNNLRVLRKWLELNISNLTLAQIKKIRYQIETMEIIIEVNNSLRSG